MKPQPPPAVPMTSYPGHELVLTVVDLDSGGSITYTTIPGILEALADHLGPDGKPVLVQRRVYNAFDRKLRRPTTYYVSQHQEHRSE